MDADAARSILARRVEALRGLGVASLSLFGSTVRGEARPDSDVDLLVEVDWARAPGFSLIEMARIQADLGDALAGRAHVVLAQDLPAEAREAVSREAVRIF
jgi:predicted nucleotidyltransferase